MWGLGQGRRDVSQVWSGKQHGGSLDMRQQPDKKEDTTDAGLA